MKRLLISCLLAFAALYLYTMNSTENRQRLCDENSISYSSFRRAYTDMFHEADVAHMSRCFSVYLGLLDYTHRVDSSKKEVQDTLVAMGLCDMDHGLLVLKRFEIQDSLPRLSVNNARIRK